jgi:SapC protein
MDIKPPYGYQEIVPLTKAHRVVLPDGRKLPLAFRNLAALPLSFTEFAAAGRDYPIAFVSGDGGKSFVAMMVLGLEHQQNLFVTPDGTWDSSAYLPAYVRRYPFCMARVTVSGQEQPERIACVEKRAIGGRGEPLYDAQGEPLAAWEQRRKLLFEFEADLARTEEMCHSLAGLGLLETFTMQAVPNQGAPFALAGMHRVVEQRLHELPAEKIKELGQAGVLARVYAHLISLNNFARLLDRRAAINRIPDAPGVEPLKLN